MKWGRQSKIIISLSLLATTAIVAIASELLRAYSLSSDLTQDNVQQVKVDFNSLKFVSDTAGEYVFTDSKDNLIVLADPPPATFTQSRPLQKEIHSDIPSKPIGCDESDPTGTEFDFSKFVSNSTPPVQAPLPPENHPAPPVVIAPIQDAKKIADRQDDREFREELVRAAINKQRALEQSARADDEVLRKPFTRLPMDEMVRSLTRAQDSIDQAAETLDNAQGGLYRSDRLRFRNAHLNARDKIESALEAARRETDAQSKQFISFFSAAQSGGSRRPAKLSMLEALFGHSTASERSATSADSLADRIALLYALSEDQRAKLLKDLQLAENREFSLPDGSKAALPILHNGYVLGGGESALDCSSFVSAILPPDVRSGQLTTLDFRQMWIYRRTGKFPVPPLYDEERGAMVRRVSQSFSAINPYKGEPIITGDLLIFRLPHMAVGHIFVIRDYNPKTQVARVIEAAQSAGTIRERDFAVALKVPGSEERVMRPGLLVLRLRPARKESCEIPTRARAQNRAPYRSTASAPVGKGVGK